MSGNFYPEDQIFVREYTPYGGTAKKADVYTSRDNYVFERVQTAEDLKLPSSIPDMDLTMPPKLKRVSVATSDELFAANLEPNEMMPLKDYLLEKGHSALGALPKDVQDALLEIAPIAPGVKSARKGPRA